MTKTIKINEDEFFVVSSEEYMSHCKKGRASLNLNGETLFLIEKPKYTDSQVLNFLGNALEHIEKPLKAVSGVMLVMRVPLGPVFQTKPCSSTFDAFKDLFEQYEAWANSNE